jgi:hypothetical protein
MLGNTPSAVAGDLNTDIVSVLDLDPEIMNKLFRRFGDQGLGAFEMMKSLGYTKPSSQYSYAHFEEDWIHETVKVLAVTAAAAGAGQATTFSLDTDNFYNGSVYVRVGDQILLKNDVMVLVTDVTLLTSTTGTVTVAPFDQSVNIAGAITAADTLIIVSNAYAEGTGQPGGVAYRTIYDEGFIQTVKETHRITGHEMNTKKWYDVLSDGKKIDGSHAIGTMQAQYRLKMKINMALLLGNTMDNTLITDDAGLNPEGLKFQTTEGLLPYIRRTGNQLDHTANSWTIAKFDAIERILDAQLNTGEVCIFMGLDLAIENSNVMKDYFANTDHAYIRKASSSKLFGGNEGLSASVDFSGFRKNNRDYYFQRMPVFTHPKLGGAAGYDFTNKGFVLPLGLRKAVDPSTGGNVMLPTFGCRYPNHGHNRMVQVWEDGAAGPNPSKFRGDVDKHSLHFRAEVGFEGVAGNSMIMIEQQ